LAALAAMGTATAGIPPVTYLVPDDFTPARDQTVNLHIEAGAALAAQTTDWPTNELEWFFWRGDGKQENRQTLAPATPQLRSVAVRAYPGVTVIGLNKKPVAVEASGTELAAFLSANVAGMKEDPAVRKLSAQLTAKLRRFESATTMVRVATGDVRDLHSAVAQNKTGQTAEIQALFDPTRLRAGADLPVRVHLRGTKQAGAQVRATCLAGGRSEERITDPTGSTYFRITQPGAWRIEWHHAEPLAGDPAADWVLYTATLTFEVPAEGGDK
jgi:hypothetical protein